jgi:hypothetical protein
VSSQPPLAFLGNYVSVAAATPDVRAASSRFTVCYGGEHSRPAAGLVAAPIADLVRPSHGAARIDDQMQIRRLCACKPLADDVP